MLCLNLAARIALTDSGGIQEECTILGTPCLVLRKNTDRPITLRRHGGTCEIVGNNIEKISEEFHNSIKMQRHPFRPELWDGKTSLRCIHEIINYLN